MSNTQVPGRHNAHPRRRSSPVDWSRVAAGCRWLLLVARPMQTFAAFAVRRSGRGCGAGDELGMERCGFGENQWRDGRFSTVFLRWDDDWLSSNEQRWGKVAAGWLCWLWQIPVTTCAKGIQCNVVSNEEPPVSESYAKICHCNSLQHTPTMHWPGETVVSVDQLPKCQHSYHSYHS